MNHRSDSTDLAVIDPRGVELHESASQAAAAQEIQAAALLAMRFPRDEDRAYQIMIRASGRYEFAQRAQYCFKRGKGVVKGPSIYLAREFARAWGNIRHGFEIVFENHETRTIRCWAWDVQHNTRSQYEDSFSKLIFRKGPDGQGAWVKPDERDLRELTNHRASIGKRNCILDLLPSDLVDSICHECDQTLRKGASEDPDRERRSILKAFAAFSVTAADLREYLGCPIDKANPEQVAELRAMWSSIRDGQSSWMDYITKPEPAKEETSGSASLKRPRKKMEASTEPKVESQVAEAPESPAEKIQAENSQPSVGQGG